MKITKSKRRGSLGKKVLNDLLTVKLETPDVDKFDQSLHLRNSRYKMQFIEIPTYIMVKNDLLQAKNSNFGLYSAFL